MAKKKSLVWQRCSEKELSVRIKAWVKEQSLLNTVIFLEGEMGAGKSTWVRTLLQELCPTHVSHGSPTFPLVQEYPAKDVFSGAAFLVDHIDLYRLKNETELQDSGIDAQIEEPGRLACVEWGSLFPETFSYWMNPALQKRKAVFKVTIDRVDEVLRDYTIEEMNVESRD